MMRVNGPGGITVNFPDGTDHQTIDRVMREAVQTQGANGRVAGAFDAAAPMEGREAPTAYTGALLPISKDIGGHLHPAVPRAVSGLAQSVGDFFSPPANPMGPEGHPTDEAMNWGMNAAMLASPASAGMKAGERMIPGVAQAVRREKPPVPTSEELRAAGGAGYDAVRDMGVDYHPHAVASAMQDLQNQLYRDGFRDKLAPKTFDILGDLTTVPAAGPGESVGISLTDLDTARRSLRKAARDFTNPTEQEAASQVIAAIDKFTENPDTASVVAGPAAAAGAVQKEARGNYAAAMRSRTFAGKQDQAELNAGAANSGANIDNALRQRVRDVLKSDKAKAGFSTEELSLMRNFVLGSKSRNITRKVANLLSGGGGAGSFLTGMAGMGAGGYALGAPGAAAGVALPMLGWGAKVAQNAMARKGMTKIDEAVRKRSPLYQQMQANAPVNPISPEMRAAALRAMMLYGASPQSGGGGY